MRVIEQKIYKLEELDHAAREKALERISLILHDGFDGDYLEEYLEELLDGFGLTDLTIKYSFSYSQGDGVAFYGSPCLHTLMHKMPIGLQYRMRFNGMENGSPIWDLSIGGEHNRYHHWNSMSVELEFVGDEDDETFFEDLEEDLDHWIIDYIRMVSGELETKGYECIESMTNEQACIDFIEANEYEFFEDGSVA